MRFSILIPLLVLFGCGNLSPEIIIPEDYKIGQAFDFNVIGLVANETYDIIAEKEDAYGREWHSNATFIADANGHINLGNSVPVKGTYRENDLYGLFWSMKMKEDQDSDLDSAEPKDFSIVNFTLLQDMDTLDFVSTTQWIIPESVEIELISGEVVAEIIRPASFDQPLPAIILLGGSGGGLSWARRMGALLADEGYATMALAYFNADGLPQHLAQIPLEYIDSAINSFTNREFADKDRLGMLGYSKGAELALLTASRRSEIKCVAAIAPGSAVFAGFKPPTYPVLSSWTLNGEDLPFVPNAYDKRFFETFDGMYLWYRTLTQHDDFEQAAIQVENINGDILLISGVRDQIWPATYMSEQIVSRLYIADFENYYEHISFPFAGHGIADPPGHPTTSISQRLGGTAYGNARARNEVWVSLKDFFGSSFNPE